MLAARVALVCVEVPSVDLVVTVTSTWPVPAGGVAVMDDALFTVTDVAGLPPNDTPEVVVVNPEPLKSVPWIVTAGAPQTTLRT